jgi:hypothetical protein
MLQAEHDRAWHDIVTLDESFSPDDIGVFNPEF